MNISISFNIPEKIDTTIDTYIIIYNRENYFDLKNQVPSNYNEFKDYSFAINWNNNFYEVSVFSKNKNIKYKSVKLLRNVLAPYVVKDENGVSHPRGWFYGEDGKPQRYTGISNSMYFSKSKWDSTFSAPLLYLLLMMFTDFTDNIICNIKEFNIVTNKMSDFMQYASKHFIYEK